jgi:tubulin--tyrosine ligase
MLLNPVTHIANTYIIRKALIRKHYLSTTIQSWITKNPTDVLATHFKACNEFEVDYAEFLDDALLEAWELKSSLDKNENSQPGKRDWWILKPGMSDRGQGIRLFSTMDELQAIFDEWDAGLPDSDDEEEIEEDVSANAKDYIMTSQLRHFVAQPYIANPLLLNLRNSLKPHKFHVRTYVLAVGALKVYVYSEMLALFANTPYIPPWDQELPGMQSVSLT